MFDPTQIEDKDDEHIPSEAERWAILIAVVVACTAGAWAIIWLIPRIMGAGS